QGNRGEQIVQDAADSSWAWLALLMIVEQINVAGVAAFEPKDDAPVSGDRYGPEACKVALERMQTKTRQVHIADLRSFFETRENPLDLSCMIRQHPPSVSLLEQELEALVAEADDHREM